MRVGEEGLLGRAIHNQTSFMALERPVRKKLMREHLHTMDDIDTNWPRYKFPRIVFNESAVFIKHDTRPIVRHRHVKKEGQRLIVRSERVRIWDLV